MKYVLYKKYHRLIESKKIRFLLTGSSTRKVRSQGANMLGGRAREAHLFPFVSDEIDDFNLNRYLNFGGLPRIYLSDDPIEDLKAYGRTYLIEEIKIEAAVRNYERFVRFMETMALSNGQEINYQSLGSDSGVPARTIEGHIEVLKDTFIGFELLPLPENSSDLGVSFEQFIVQEIRAYLSYSRKEKNLTFWKTRGFEVDLLVGRDLAIEIKYSKQFKSEYLDGLLALKEENLWAGKII